MTVVPDVLILGAGVFGLATARELRRRGATVTVVDQGDVPHPDAASTDISKLVRGDYGADVFYTELFEDAVARWRAFNEELGRTLFHETGMLVLSSEPLAPGSFEGDSFTTLKGRGYALERLDADTIRERFPAWRDARWVDGYVNPVGGWAESGAVVAALAELATREGVALRTHVRASVTVGARPNVRTDRGEELPAGAVLVAAGAASPSVLPELADRLRSVGQPVFHFDAPDPAFASPSFMPWAADIGRTGWYGFPARGNVLKIANHGEGKPIDPTVFPRENADDAEPLFRDFLRARLPRLAAARVLRTRRCLYCDAFDGDFFVDAHPSSAGLFVASGGSGHAFKFALSLGVLAADVVTGAPNRFQGRFRMRPLGPRRVEQARNAASG